jgi:hypothetical protein
MVSEAQVVWRGGAAPDAPTPGKSTAFEEAAYSLSPRLWHLHYEWQGTADVPSTQAAFTQEPEGPGFRISCSALTQRATAPNLTRAAFETLTWDAVNNCPISRLLRTQIWLDATLL